MKPCASRRESIALLACGLCPGDEAVDLRIHLRSCSGCREYFRELSTVCDEHTTAAAHLPEVRVPSRLFRHLAARIRSASEVPPSGAPQGAFLGWVGIAGWAALLLLLGVLAMRLDRPFEAPQVSPMAQIPEPPPAAGGAPSLNAGNTLLAYRLALNRSPEALEELLSKEGVKSAPAPQIALRAVTDLLELEL